MIAATSSALLDRNSNLQNILIRTDAGPADPGRVVVGDGYAELMTADYSQIEMRIMAHLSGDEGLIEAFNTGGGPVRSSRPGRSACPSTSHRRAAAPGHMAGPTAGLRVERLRPVAAVKNLHRGSQRADGRVFRPIRRVRGLRAVVERARKDGYTRRCWGRRRYPPELGQQQPSSAEAAERAAPNAPIQVARGRHHQGGL